MLRTLTLGSLAIIAVGAMSVQPPAPASGNAAPQSASTGVTPVLSPADSMKTFAVAPGYRVELVASEPMVEDPVAMEFDPDGRLWVVEMPGYMRTIAAANEHEPLGRIVVLQDTDDDGRMDKRTVFADKLVLARTIKVLTRGVLVGEPPNLWLMRDTDGDLTADARELVTDKYGTREANVEHNANSLTWALDNWMHTSEIDIYLRLKQGAFEVRSTPARGQWGNSQDDAGRIYRNTNESALHVDLVPTPYYGRNPNLLRTRGSYESLAGEGNELNAVWPVRPTRGVNRGYVNGVLRPDGRLAAFTSVGAPLVYRGDRLPADAYGNVFLVEPAGNLVSRILLNDSGTTITAKKAYEGSEFLASTDERFRPVNLSNAPDGTLYLLDMYRGIIQHRGYITEYLRDHIVSSGLEQPIGYGRIYRVVHETTRRDSRPSLSAAPSAALVKTLAHPNGWWRDTAQQLLVERGDASVVPALTSLAGAPDYRTRLHALWTLDGMDRIDKALVLKALEDPSRDVRISALRLAERWLVEGDAVVRNAVLARMADQDLAVRRQLAATVGTLEGEPRDTAAVGLLEKDGDDPIVLDATLSGVAGSEAALMDRLASSETQSPQRSAALTVLAATILRGKEEPAVQRVFEQIAEASRPEWQRASMIAGVEAAVLNTPLPGSIVRARAAGPAPCPTCPGGRSGPGGASAFPAAGRAGTAAAGPAGRGRGSSGIALTLTREPALVRAAAEGGVLGGRAAAVLERIGWPGKPGMSTIAATPLTAVEQQRFEAGQEVYKGLCEACHQADGRGREKLAPTLLGSELALGPDGVPIRVLLNGKEGQVGLMPPLGASLTDDQVAAVLTYIRRAWSQSGSPVDPAAVAAVRKEVAARSRPWTNEELQGLLNSGGR